MNGPIHLFSVRKIPVYAEPWFFFLLAYMVVVADSVVNGLIWVVCVCVSLLIHELGHGFAALWFKLGPSVVLHGWGGFTIHASARRDRDDALIVAAGPGAGILFGTLVFAASFVTNLVFPGFIAARPILAEFVDDLLFINLFWSLVNLVPMFPLDGGLLFRLAAYKLLRPATAERVVHGLGLLIAAAWASAALALLDSVFLALMGLLFAWENFAVLSGRKSAPKARVASPQATGLLDEARKALAAGDPREAARLCHLLRAGNDLPPRTLDACFELLAVATSALGQHAEALSYAKHADPTARVVQVRVEALVALGRVEEARAVLAEHGKALGAASLRALQERLSA